MYYIGLLFMYNVMDKSMSKFQLMLISVVLAKVDHGSCACATLLISILGHAHKGCPSVATYLYIGAHVIN